MTGHPTTQPESPGPATRLTAILMGTGTSHGVPMLGCDCDVCCSENPFNKRTRTSLLIQAPSGNIVVDTPPDLRSQLLRHDVKRVHAALFTHSHADHIYGLDDLRAFGHYLDREIPLYCEPNVRQMLVKSFAYAFAAPAAGDLHPGARPRFRLESITPGPLHLLDVHIQAIRLQHGPLETLGFRIGNFAFCTDVNRIPEESLPLLEGLDDFVIDALRHEPHPTHFSVAQALDVVAQLKPRRAWLTHISHLLEHEATNAELPPNVRVAYDGLKLPIRYL